MKTICEDRREEFCEVEQTAMAYLARPRTLPKAQSLEQWHSSILLWHYPAFGESRSWGIYQRRGRGDRTPQTLVRQVVWDRVADSERFFYPLIGLEKGFHPYPTIEIRDRPLDGEHLESRLATLRTVSFPAFFVRANIGIDGEVFGLSYPNGTRIEWWCDGPESWWPLTSWAAEMRIWLTDITALPPQTEMNEKVRPCLS